MDRTSNVIKSVRSTRGAMLVFGVAGVVASLWISAVVMLHAPITTDEMSYEFQAHIFSEGKLKREAPPVPDAFRSRCSMIIVDEEAGWFSRYAPGHSLWLVPGVWLGHLYWMSALACGLGAALMVWTASRLGASPWVAGLVVLTSPYYLFTQSTLLSHTSGLVASAGMLAAYVGWRQTGRSSLAVWAGLAWSFLFLNRSYTALLLAIPFGLDALWCLARRPTRAGMMGTAGFVLASVVGVAGVLIYNDVMVGSPWLMTYLFYNPSDGIGFGLRHHWPEAFPYSAGLDHTLENGLGYLKENLQSLNQWLYGVPGGLVLLGGLTAVGWSRRWMGLLLGGFFVLALGYVAFWYQGWNVTGPIYQFEAYPMLAVISALGFTRGGRWLRRVPRVGAAVLVAGLGWWAVQAPSFVKEQAATIHRLNRPKVGVFELYRHAPEGSLLFIEEWLSFHTWESHDFVYNPRGLDGSVVVARYHPAYVRHVAEAFPDRTPLQIHVEKDLATITLYPASLDPHLDVGSSGSSISSRRTP